MLKLRRSRGKEREIKPASDDEVPIKPAAEDPMHQQQKKGKKQPAIVSFFKRIKLRRRLFARSRSRSRSRDRRRQNSPLRKRSDNEGTDEDVADGSGSPGAYDICPLPPPGRKLRSASAFTSVRLNAWTSPYDFAVQTDRLLVPGLDVAEFSLAQPCRTQGDASSWPASLGHRAPLCIDATPGLIYLTAISTSGRCGLFVFDRAGRLAASRLEASTRRQRSDGGATAHPSRPGMFAVRVNFRGECWVTNPRQLTVDHYTPAPALKRIRSIDVARFGVPYYLAVPGHRLTCLWVSFPETRRVVKFDWLTLEPLCHLSYPAGQSPCGLHLDERFDQLYVTDIGTGHVLVYRAGSMGLAVACTRAANAVLTAASGGGGLTGQRPAAVRLVSKGSRALLLLLRCPAATTAG
ncbi:hypothetical protein BOX15_Mlig007223g3 [Macrostomum lignano]|uniref:Uncharacterized protein n=1 Tax=Macrostomum lignano TaxID=282301 RepID=A0A267DD07_9PLAT|nr:hypothetical protein BOX15_Mlig007223g3 [Macrostomum lignano]